MHLISTTRRMNNYELLIHRLDEFIRKFYINKLLKGILYFIALILLMYLVFVVFEYFNYSSSSLRKGMFYTLILAGLGSFVYWIVLPALNFFSLGKVISHEQAATIIGKHFTDVEDRLLNILQLHEQSKATHYSESDLINASINQKIEKLKPVPFKAAIDLTSNRKYLKYALPPLAIFIIILFAAPNILREGTERLINPDKIFAKKAPFTFQVLNDTMQVVQYENITIEAITEGLVKPNEIYLQQDGYTYKMTKTEDGKFTYTFNKLQKDTEFYLKSGEYNSDEYKITVIPKPSILSMKAYIHYPSYIGKPDEELNYIGDMTLPQGTSVTWNFNTMNTDVVQLAFDSVPVQANQDDDDNYSYSKKFMKNSVYQVHASNSSLQNNDPATYYVNVIADQFPSISAEQFIDSSDKKHFWFYGDLGDDYGIRNLQFVYKIESAKTGTKQASKPIPATIQGTTGSFAYNFGAAELGMNPGDRITYYFEVFDNDGVNGSKASRSQFFTYKEASLEEMQKQSEQSKEEIKDQLEKAQEQAKALQQEFKKMQEKILQKKTMSYEDKKKMQELLDKQKEFEKNIKELQEKYKENRKNEEQFKDKTEDIKEKEEALEKMMEQTMNEEMKKLMEKMQELMEKMNKDEMLEQSKEMEMNNEQSEKELEQMLELFKKMELEEKIQETVQKLEELAKKQEELGEKTETGEKSEEQSKKEQEEIKKEFDQAKEDIKDIEKKNQELGNKSDDKMEEAKEESKQADKNMESAQEQLEKKDKKKASKNQKNAAENMQEMANKMQQMMNKQQSEELEMDMKALRQILENLVKTSFDQEKLINDVNTTSINDPRYIGNMNLQKRIKDNYKIIEDSLDALAKRVFTLGPMINDELEKINKHMSKGLGAMEARQVPVITTEQQYVMTSLNNLALILSEVMQSMQMEMKNKMSGNGSCDKPGGSGMGMGEIAKMQKQLSDKITKGAEKGKGKGQQKGEGEKPGDNGSKPGGQGQGQGGELSSKEIAEMAARQAALRRALEELNQKENKNGKGKYGDLSKILDQMNKTEEDLVNRRLSTEMLRRQQDILTRLLEAEQANRFQEQDNQRKSESGQELNKPIPPALQDYIKKRQAEIEQYKTVPPSLTPYYKKLVEEYFRTIGGK